MPSAPTPFRALGRLDIRVLHLHPGQRDGPLAGWLQHTTWVDPPQYEALSYEWGSPEKTRTITLEGGFEFQITQSLYDALCDLRQDASPGKPRTLWADAICINQEDLGELQNQVSIMATIYRKAARVVTYIGPERDDSTSAITFARELKARVDKSHDRSFPRVDFTLPPLDDYRWVGLKALILRTWVRSLSLCHGSG